VTEKRERGETLIGEKNQNGRGHAGEKRLAGGVNELGRQGARKAEND